MINLKKGASDRPLVRIEGGEVRVVMDSGARNIYK